MRRKVGVSSRDFWNLLMCGLIASPLFKHVGVGYDNEMHVILGNIALRFHESTWEKDGVLSRSAERFDRNDDSLDWVLFRQAEAGFEEFLMVWPFVLALRKEQQYG
jgi:hypothetical protein